MAHAIRLGIDRMVTTSNVSVWHADETLRDGRLIQIAAKDPETTLLEMAAYVWPSDADNDVAGTVELKLANEAGTKVESHVATVSRSGRILGIVGANYNVVPFKVILAEWIHALTLAGGAPETLGTFDAGESMFSTLLVSEPWRVPGDPSRTRPYFNVYANHAGKGGIRGSFATLREVCKNTAMMYVAGHDSTVDAKERAEKAWVTVQHTSNAVDRMRDAVKWITDGRARAESERAMMERMASKLISKAEVDTFIETYISIGDDASKRSKSIRTGDRDKFVADMQDSDLGDHALTSKGITAYGLFQAVTHFEDWTTRSVARDGDESPVGTRRAFRAFLGKRETEKLTAREQILALVG